MNEGEMIKAAAGSIRSFIRRDAGLEYFSAERGGKI